VFQKVFFSIGIGNETGKGFIDQSLSFQAHKFGAGKIDLLYPSLRVKGEIAIGAKS